MDQKQITETINEIKKEIGVEKLIDIYENGDVKVKYSKLWVEEKPGDPSWLNQKDMLKIFKNDQLIAQHKPNLDPFITVKDNILCLTSDGECWVYNLDKNIENNLEIPVVPFYHEIEFDETTTHKNLPNTFCVKGSACCWGAESWPLNFEFYFDKDTLNCTYWNIRDEETGYEEKETN